MKKNGLVPFTFTNATELLTEPGDEINIRMTKSRRIVGKVNTKLLKMSQTLYPTTGTIVKQQVIKTKDR